MAERYHIRVKRYLDPNWSAGGPLGVDNLTIIQEVNGDAALAGSIVDEAALHGVLIKVRHQGVAPGYGQK